MRKGELFGLRWRDLALDRGRLDVMRSYRQLPMGGDGADLVVCGDSPVPGTGCEASSMRQASEPMNQATVTRPGVLVGDPGAA
jgi:hypothetical protein